ncbi:sodium:pantothenate symporter [Virgibacillus sp. NKC19-16]|uniref:sodium:solute symporter family transporter n=1 Tax=Virgibacillus salidurans TaxID=2831673 RepID=UPI001F225C91|nr:sodium:pantothenate symporter [Virgibacillus sp. NKC19-16]UJL45430.1 sodium:pantothenate symporter [Virgibacillus sp. NKC19-16]
MELKTLVWIGFILFMAVMFGIGYIASKKTKTMSDFAIASSGLGPVVLGLSFSATALSAATFMGYPAYSYTWGFSNLWIMLAIIIGASSGVLIVAKRAKKINTKQKSLSLSDWLGDFYNSDIIRVGTAIIMLFNIFYIASQFAAGARVVQYFLDLPYVTGLIIIAVVVMAYVFFGGTIADIYTDAVQAVLMCIAGVVVFISGIIIFGQGNITTAFSNISVNLQNQNQQLVETFNTQSPYFYSLSAVLGIFVIQAGVASSPQLFNKVLALKNEKDLGKMLLVFFITTLLSVVVIFGGLYARVALPELETTDFALIAYIEFAFPIIASAFLAIVILAAVMSTTDGLFVVLSTVFANDIFLKFFVKKGIVKVDDKKANKIAMWISRWAVILVGLIAMIIVFNPPEHLADILWIGVSGVSAGSLGPIIYAVYGKKTGKAITRLAEVSMVVGLLSYLILYFGGIERSVMASGGYATLIGVATIWIGSFLVKSTPEVADEGNYSETVK